MEQEHEIIRCVLAAQQDTQAADALVRKYLPFIKSETAKFLNRIPREGCDDELGIAMFAFHEAAMAYRSGRGSFLKLAAVTIRNRLIDYRRRELRHKGLLSLDQSMGDEEESRTMLEAIDSAHDEILHRQCAHAAREEIENFIRQLSGYDLKLTDIAENCPKQTRTLTACHRVLTCARENPVFLEQLVANTKIPITALSTACGVERKTMERHRKYLVALLLAFTNGFEIIRGHLKQMTSGKEGGNEWSI